MVHSLSYFAFGLHIRADFPLWPWGGSETVEGSKHDVTVELATGDQAFTGLGFEPGQRDALLEWPGVGAFRIVDGERIVVWPVPTATSEELALVSAGPALAMLLEQRGHAVLHGSCVDLGGQAIALLGPSGVGKSTTAAALSERGYRLLSDGMTVVDLAGPKLLALPGPPHLKLWPDVIGSLSATEAASRPIVRQEKKRWYDARGIVAVHPMPLRSVYVLAPGPEVSRERLSPAASLIGLMRNYFLADFARAMAREFMLQRCRPLAEAISVFTLQRGSVLADLRDVMKELTRSA